MSNGISMEVWNTLTGEQKAAISAAMAAQATTRKAKISFKVGNKGGVSMYGINRFPVTLYVEQWETVKAEIDNLMAFAATNKVLIEERIKNPIVVPDKE